MNQQKYHREDQPDRGQRVEKPEKDVSNHSLFGMLSASVFAADIAVGTGGSSGGFNRWILTRATRRRSISTTVKRKSSKVKTRHRAG